MVRGAVCRFSWQAHWRLRMLLPPFALCGRHQTCYWQWQQNTFVATNHSDSSFCSNEHVHGLHHTLVVGAHGNDVVRVVRHGRGHCSFFEPERMNECQRWRRFLVAVEHHHFEVVTSGVAHHLTFHNEGVSTMVFVIN